MERQNNSTSYHISVFSRFTASSAVPASIAPKIVIRQYSTNSCECSPNTRHSIASQKIPVISARRSEPKATIRSGTSISGFTNSGKYAAKKTTIAADV